LETDGFPPNGSSFLTPLAASFVNTASRFGSRTALWVGGQDYSYRDLHQLASELAGGFPAPSKDGYDTCAILAHRSVVAYAGILACHFMRHAYVALTPIQPIGRSQSIVAQSQPAVLIADSACLHSVPALLQKLDKPIVVLLPDQRETPPWAADFPQHVFLNRTQLTHAADPQQGGEQDLAYVMYTSGSTGEPKGVMVTHNNVMTYARNVVEYLSYDEHDRFIHLPELNFDLSVHDLFAAWNVGGSLYCVPQDEVMIPGDFVRQHRLTAWTSVPSAVAILKKFNKLSRAAFESLRVSMFCGEPFPGVLAADWIAAASNSRVENFYGPTETTVAVTAYPCSRGTDAPVLPLGEPFNGQEVLVCDENLNPVEDGEVGELLLGGTQVSVGYWNRPDLTAAQFVEKVFAGRSSSRWYRTGDLACNQAGVGLTYRGRATRQIKIHGYRVELGEIEATLRKFSGKEFVAVVPVRGSAAETLYLSAFVEGLTADDEKSVRAESARLLPNYMMPRYIFAIEQMPLNPNGKIDYAELERINERRAKLGR
jgi:amino acid adenylation domain-containing protein